MRSLLAGAVAVVCLLGLGGCRAGAAAPAAPPPGVSSGTAGDPLAGVESELDAVERAVDADGGASGGGAAPRR